MPREHEGYSAEVNNVLKHRIATLEGQLLVMEEERDAFKKKLAEAEDTNRSIVDLNQKLNEQLWSLQRKESGGQGGETLGDAVHQDVRTGEEDDTGDPTPPEQILVGTSITGRTMREGGERRKHKAGHIIITSSLGKDLNAERLAPSSHSRVYVKAISGAKINDIRRFVEHAPFEHKSVTILVGGNDVDEGKPLKDCAADYTALLDSIRKNNPEAHISFVEVPPRMNNDEVRNRIYNTNQWLSELCADPNNEDCTFIRNGLTERADLYQDDKIHLSKHKGGGVSRLAMSIRSAVMACEAPADVHIKGRNVAPPNQYRRRPMSAPRGDWRDDYSPRNHGRTPPRGNWQNDYRPRNHGRTPHRGNWQDDYMPRNHGRTPPRNQGREYHDMLKNFLHVLQHYDERDY